MTSLLCPLCTQSRFDTLEALRVRLVTAATQNITCPVCNEQLMGLDKFTIHLFGHTLITPSPEPFTESISEKTTVDDENLCTVNMEDLSFLTSWETSCKRTGDIKMCSNSENFIKAEIEMEESIEGDLSNRIEFPTNFNSPVVDCQNFELQNFSDKVDPKINDVPVQETRDLILQPENLQIPSSPHDSPASPTLVFNAFLGNSMDCSRILLQPVSFMASEFSERQVRSVENSPKAIQPTSNPQSPESAAIQNTAENVELSEYMSDLLKQKLMAPSILIPEHNEQFMCEYCGLEMKSSTELATHKEVIHGEQQTPFHCRICGRGFKMRGSLLVHARVAHGGYGAENSVEGYSQEPRNFHCTICSKSFKKEQHLTQHVKTHDGKQWQCETCSKYFTTKYFLKKHQRLHTGEMPYCCETCKKTFTFQQSYHKHLLYHSADKPHECQECGRSFKELSTLHNHQRIHSGEKPFACETCGKCFRQRVSYIVHQRIHTGVLPYQCTACKKKFRYKVSQRSHKCTVQPPGVVVRQPGDLIQRILEQRQNILKCLE